MFKAVALARTRARARHTVGIFHGSFYLKNTLFSVQRMSSTAAENSLRVSSDTPSENQSQNRAPGINTDVSNVSPLGVLDRNSGPLVWIDLEMTGLNPKADKIMEIAVIITDGNLQRVDGGLQYIVRVGKDDLDKMDEWCTNQHGSSGLTQACLDSPHSLSSVEEAVLSYIKKWIPEKRTGVLAGNSVHVDRVFLMEHMPSLVDHLHYRIVDVSTIKELCHRWYPGHYAPRTVPEKSSHRALEDIRGSIRELLWYRRHIFVSRVSTTAHTSDKPQ